MFLVSGGLGGSLVSCSLSSLSWPCFCFLVGSSLIQGRRFFLVGPKPKRTRPNKPIEKGRKTYSKTKLEDRIEIAQAILDGKTTRQEAEKQTSKGRTTINLWIRKLRVLRKNKRLAQEAGKEHLASHDGRRTMTKRKISFGTGTKKSLPTLSARFADVLLQAVLRREK